MLLVALLLLLLCSRPRNVAARFVPARKSRPGWTHRAVRSQRKPDWVIHELLLIKAWTPKLGCRRIAEVFNRRHVDNGMSVSKSFVARMLTEHGEALAKLRHKLRRAGPPADMSRNAEWAMDLTEVRGKDRIPHRLLGLIDYGTRACLALHELADKRCRTIWQQLLTLFRKYGSPKRLRVDNEASLNSRWLKLGLRLLGVRLITTRPHSPWQHGRIERLFRSFKDDVRKLVAGDLALRLQEWRWHYNFARPHMAIGYRTPAEAWDGRCKSTGPGVQISLWKGALRTYFFPR